MAALSRIPNHRLVVFAVLAFVLGGCASTPLEKTSRAASELAKLSDDKKPNLDQSARTNLCLIRETRLLHVGDDAEVALDLFPKSMAPQSYIIDDLPRVFPSQVYSAKGWDSPGGDGFGVIIYNKQVAAAIWNRSFTDEAQADAAVKEYQDQIQHPGQPKFGYGSNTYYFWDAKPQQRLMILKAAKPNGKWALTLALGDNVVLDALGISRDAAWHDIEVLKRLEKQGTEGAKGKGG